MLAFCACLVVLLCPSAAVAQTTPDLEQGMKPYGSYDAGAIDSVNLLNGNLHLRVPLVSYPQRGGKLPLKFFIQYNNKGYIAVPDDINQPNGQHHWQYKGQGVTIVPDFGANFYIGDGIQRQTFKGLDYKGDAFTVFVCTLVTADGSTHQLTDCDDPAARALDTSGLLPSVDRKGNFAASGTTIADTNGNQITVTSTTNSSGFTESITDTLGRSVPGWTYLNNGSTKYPSPYLGATTTNLSNCQGPVVAATLWKVPAPGSGTESYKFCYQQFSYQTAFGVPAVTETSGTVPMLSQIILPNGTYWLFSYNTTWV